MVIAAALVYPSVMLINKTNNFHPQQWTLDGNAYLKVYRPDEVLAMNWLNTQPMGIVAEAVGDDYSDAARVSSRLVFRRLLGGLSRISVAWGATEVGTRQQDMKDLYEKTDWIKSG